MRKSTRKKKATTNNDESISKATAKHLLRKADKAIFSVDGISEDTGMPRSAVHAFVSDIAGLRKDDKIKLVCATPSVDYAQLFVLNKVELMSLCITRWGGNLK